MFSGLTIISSSINVLTSSNTLFAYFEHFDSSQLFTNASQTQIFINGNRDLVDGGLTSLWNRTTSKFIPTVTSKSYSLIFEGLVLPQTTSPTFHLDLVFSGSTPDFGRKHQGTEFYIRNSGLGQHIHSVFELIITDELVASGAIFLASSSGATITMLSSSVWIKES